MVRQGVLGNLLSTTPHAPSRPLAPTMVSCCCLESCYSKCGLGISNISITGSFLQMGTPGPSPDLLNHDVRVTDPGDFSERRSVRSTAADHPALIPSLALRVFVIWSSPAFPCSSSLWQHHYSETGLLVVRPQTPSAFLPNHFVPAMLSILRIFTMQKARETKSKDCPAVLTGEVGRFAMCSCPLIESLLPRKLSLTTTVFASSGVLLAL